LFYAGAARRVQLSLSSLPLLLVLGVPLAPGVALGVLPLIFVALPLLLVLSVPLASGEAPVFLFLLLLFAVLLLLLVLLGGVALESLGAGRRVAVPLLLLLPLFFVVWCGARPWCWS
jgi:hypothetical protein